MISAKQSVIINLNFTLFTVHFLVVSERIIDYIAFNFVENQYNSLVAFWGGDLKDPEIKITINNLR